MFTMSYYIKVAMIDGASRMVPVYLQKLYKIAIIKHLLYHATH